MLASCTKTPIHRQNSNQYKFTCPCKLLLFSFFCFVSRRTSNVHSWYMHLTWNCWFIKVYIENERLIIGDIRNRGNVKSLCFVRQGTKVDSIEECDQIISTPHIVGQDSAILSPSRVGPPSILKRHNIPRQVLKLIPSRFWKLVPCKVRTSLPSFIQSYSSQGLITGLSSAICHGRSPSVKFFLFPSGVCPWCSQAEFIFLIPSGIHHWSPQQASHQISAKYLCHRAIPRQVVKDLFS